VAIACVVLTIAFALVYTVRIHRLDFTGTIYVLFAGSWLGAGCLLIFALRPEGLRNATTSIVGTLLVLLSWIELTSYVNHDRLARTERFSKPPEFVRFLQAQGGLHRVASYGYVGIPPEYGSAYGVPEIGSMNFHILPRYESLFNRLILPNPSDRWTTFATMVNAKHGETLNLAAIDLVGAKYLVTPTRFHLLHKYAQSSGWRRVYANADVMIHENPDPLPRAFIVHRLVESARTPIDEGVPPREFATSDDTSLIEAARSLGIGQAKVASEAGDDTAVVSRYDHARVEIRADLKAPGVLVLTDAWHPNWSVRVDARPTELGRVNEEFRGVALAPGQHVIEMNYAPRTLALGKALSIVGLGLVCAILLLRRRIDPLMSRWFAIVR